jgi:hypothetical protein
MKQTIVKILDDLNGKPATETVQFSLDGVDYEIDLTAANGKKLRRDLKPYVESGARVRKARRAPSGPLDTRQGRDRMRSWARANGWPQLGLKGRVPYAAVEAYHAYLRGVTNVIASGPS